MWCADFKNINPLSIPAVVLRTTNVHSGSANSSSIPATPENKILARVGLALQQILKNEYGDAYTGSYPDPVAVMQQRNPRLAGISPRDALSRLKVELKGYIKEQEPFNRRFRDGQTVLSWWTIVQKDEFAYVLGALAIKIYSVCAVSMVDERMASAVTNINTSKCSLQSVQTVRDHVKIRAFHRANDPDKKPKKSKPIIKWRDMQKMIHGADDLITSSKSSVKERPPVMEHDIEALADSDGDSESESNMTTGALHENHDGLHWLDGPPQNLVNVERCAFTIEDTVNINSSYLLDLLDSTSATAATAQGQPIHRAPVLPPSIRAAPKETDWSIW